MLGLTLYKIGHRIILVLLNFNLVLLDIQISCCLLQINLPCFVFSMIFLFSCAIVDLSLLCLGYLCHIWFAFV